jgi:hypothetical protein
MQSMLKLFNAIEVESLDKTRTSRKIVKETLPFGFVFAPEVLGNYTDEQVLEFLPHIAKELGLTKEQLNTTFHKSWGHIRDANIEDLIFEQILHYITTYGFEALGIYDKDSVYIPIEKLKIPSIKKGEIKIVIIHGFTKDQIESKLLTLINSGMALKEETIDAIISLMDIFRFGFFYS